MVLFNVIARPSYHKNGTQWIGKLCARIIGEKNYEFIRLQKRIGYATFWYTKQGILLRFQQQYPHIAVWFSLLNKADTSDGFPARRQYERHQDFVTFNPNSEGWFQLWFFMAAAIVITWNWWICAYNYEVRGVSPEDDDLYRYKDSRMTTNFDRTKYNFEHYFYSPHYLAANRHHKATRDHPDDPRMNWRAQLYYYQPGEKYLKYYGYAANMRLA